MVTDGPRTCNQLGPRLFAMRYNRSTRLSVGGYAARTGQRTFVGLLPFAEMRAGQEPRNWWQRRVFGCLQRAMWPMKRAL